MSKILKMFVVVLFSMGLVLPNAFAEKPDKANKKDEGKVQWKEDKKQAETDKEASKKAWEEAKEKAASEREATKGDF